MAYDEHEEHSGPRPTQGWLVRSVQARLRDSPARRLTAALGSYDWTAGGRLAESRAADLTVQEALTTARDAGVRPHLDAGSLNPTFRSQAEDGKARPLSALGVSNLAMLAMWWLGSEDPGIWPALKLKPVAAQATLSRLSGGYDINDQSHGELLKISGAPQMGQRILKLDPRSGLVVAETTVHFASPCKAAGVHHGAGAA